MVVMIFIITSSRVHARKMSYKSTVMAEVIKARDGDTIEVVAHPWPGFSPETAIRIARVDSPELKGKCKEEKALAILAKEFLASILTKEVTLQNIRYGKYAGRYIAEVITSDGINVADSLMQAGHARLYNGGKRQGWCLINRKVFK